MEAQLSLPAEFLLLSIDPRDGGLLPHSRRGLKRALSAAGDGKARAARGRAAHELRGAGLVEPRRKLVLADRAAATQRFNRLRTAIVENDLRDPRDGDLLVLLAVAGVLQHRLDRREKKLAARRLRAMGEAFETDTGRATVTTSNPTEIPASLLAAGLVATYGTMALFDSLDLGDFVGAGGGDFNVAGSWDSTV
jgi:hypothetical protein